MGRLAGWLAGWLAALLNEGLGLERHGGCCSFYDLRDGQPTQFSPSAGQCVLIVVYSRLFSLPHDSVVSGWEGNLESRWGVFSTGTSCRPTVILSRKNERIYVHISRSDI